MALDFISRIGSAATSLPRAFGPLAFKLRWFSAPFAGRRWEIYGSRLFRKTFALLVVVVSVALLANGVTEIAFFYKERESQILMFQGAQADDAATKIGQFIQEIQSQLGWTTQLPWSAGTIDQRRFDGLRLLRQVPAITELSQLDAAGTEQLRVSRLAMDVVASQTDFSKEAKFVEAMTKKAYYGQVYFRRESEPYMTIALAGARRDAGVSVAEVNLKLIWDVVTSIKVGETGGVFVLEPQGRLIAHRDISLVLRNTQLEQLAKVKDRAAGDKSSGPGSDPDSGRVMIQPDDRGISRTTPSLRSS